MQIDVTDRDGEQRTLDAEPGQTLMMTLLLNDYDIEAACGGVASCGTCHVYVDPQWQAALAPAHADERAVLEQSRHRRPQSRLSCQIALDEPLAGLRVTIAPRDD